MKPKKYSEQGESTRENPGKQGSKTENQKPRCRNRMSQGQQAEKARTGGRKNWAGSYREQDKKN